MSSKVGKAEQAASAYSNLRKESHSRVNPGEETSSKEQDASPKKGNTDGYHGTRNKSDALDREFRGLLKMLDEGNRKIRENSGRIRPDGYDTDRGEKVPSVLGFTVNAATGALSEAGLAVLKLTRQKHPRIPAGRVLSQAPEPGSAIEGVTGVHLVISEGAI